MDAVEQRLRIGHVGAALVRLGLDDRELGPALVVEQRFLRGLAILGLGDAERFGGDLELVLDRTRVELEHELAFLDGGVRLHREMVDHAVERRPAIR